MKRKVVLFLTLSFFITCGIFTLAMQRETVSEMEIVIRDEGFTPEYLTIPAGTTVVWINNTERKRWPASNPHPTHTDYAGAESPACEGAFDACGGLAPGESFRFHFDKEGIWYYHDHLFPSHSGVIDVKRTWTNMYGLQKLKQITNYFKNISITSEEFRTLPYSEQLRILQDKSASHAWTMLKDAYVVDGAVIGNVHELAHAVGNLAYREQGFEGVRVCDPVLAYGCYHGVTEEFLLQKGPEAITDAEQSCEKIFDSATDIVGQRSCIHGIGHGLITWAGLELETALNWCDELKRVNRSSCYDGIFMEYHSSYQPFSAEIDRKQLWDLCTELPEQYQQSCAKYRIQEAFQVFNNNIATLLEWCSGSSSEILEQECIVSSGHSIAIASWQNPVQIVGLCSYAETIETTSLCIMSAAEELAFQKYESWEANVHVLCNTLVGEAAQLCMKRIEFLDTNRI